MIRSPSWSVRTAGSQRFLDLQLKPIAKDQFEREKFEKSDDGKPASDSSVTIHIRSQHSTLPARIELAHLMPGKALGFDSQIELQYANGVSSKIVAADGFVPLLSSNRIDRLQTSTGGRLELQLDRDSALAPAIELLDSRLVGELHSSSKSVSFQLRGKANVTVAGTRLRALSGKVAISQLPESSDFRLELLNSESGPVYELVFPEVGSFPIALDFVASVSTDQATVQGLDFTVAAGAVVPISLRGFDAGIEFSGDNQAIVPLLVEKSGVVFCLRLVMCCCDGIVPGVRPRPNLSLPPVPRLMRLSVLDCCDKITALRINCCKGS